MAESFQLLNARFPWLKMDGSIPREHPSTHIGVEELSVTHQEKLRSSLHPDTQLHQYAQQLFGRQWASALELGAVQPTGRVVSVT